MTDLEYGIFYTISGYYKLYLETFSFYSDKQNSRNSRLLQPKLKEIELNFLKF